MEKERGEKIGGEEKSRKKGKKKKRGDEKEEGEEEERQKGLTLNSAMQRQKMSLVFLVC